jgi:hypothetical protein
LIAPIPVLVLLDSISFFDPMILAAFIIMTLLWLHLSFGIYIIIDDDGIHSVGYPFIHRRIPFRSIREISMSPMQP